MVNVLARRQQCLRPARSFLTSLSFSVHFLLLFVLGASTPVLAQTRGFLNNGQFFTTALAINNAPAPGSPAHAGSNLVISIELSGDGRIPQSAFIPGSGLPTRYDFLELYLVSSQTNTNLTVSSGSSILTQEPGSTVKHLNWPIPGCIPPGEYNLTYYEGSTINDQSYFSITSLPLSVDNPKADTGTRCSDTNPLRSQPQTDNTPPTSPYLDLVLTTSRTIPTLDLPNLNAPVETPTASGFLTVTLGTSALPSDLSVLSAPPSTPPLVPQTTAVVVFATLQTFVVTPSGETAGVATTGLATTTLTIVDTVATGVLFPVNGAVSLVNAQASILWTMLPVLALLVVEI